MRDVLLHTIGASPAIGMPLIAKTEGVARIDHGQIPLKFRFLVDAPHDGPIPLYFSLTQCPASSASGHP